LPWRARARARVRVHVQRAERAQHDDHGHGDTQLVGHAEDVVALAVGDLAQEVGQAQKRVLPRERRKHAHAVLQQHHRLLDRPMLVALCRRAFK